jgi:hypothetical protein
MCGYDVFHIFNFQAGSIKHDKCDRYSAAVKRAGHPV